MEDRKGNFWFGSVGSGVYRYNGASFEIFTTKQGLLDNGAGSIYEDQNGHIWFGGSSGLSRYDGNSFRNYLLYGDLIYEAKSEKMKIKKHLYGVTTIMQDKTGIFWFGAGGVFRYDGKSFIPFKHDHESFKNVRSIIEDRKGHIWIGGADGLWYYDGSTVTNLTQRFVGYIMEDRRGNIWISSEKNSDEGWTLSYYDRKTLSRQAPTATTVVHSKMIFGILEDDQGHIWFGDFDGVHRYDGKNITNFNARAN